MRHLLSASKLKRLDADPHAVIDVLSAPANLATALEAYLGGRQFQLLVEDMDEAGRCISQLKKIPPERPPSCRLRGRARATPTKRCGCPRAAS